MNLENLLETTETQFNKITQNLPWYVNWIWGNEINNVKTVFKETNLNLKNYEATEDWYLNQGQLINNTFSYANNALDKAYSIYEIIKPITNLAKKIPFLREFVTDKENEYKTKIEAKTGIKNLPNQNGAKQILKSTYDATLAGYCMQASSETGKDYNDFWDKLYVPDLIKEKKEGPIEYITNTINNIFEMVVGLFEPQTYKS